MALRQSAFWVISAKRCSASHLSDAGVFHAAAGQARLLSNASHGLLFRAEELFSALHHSGESQVTSHSIYFTSLTRQQLRVFLSGGAGGSTAPASVLRERH